MHEEMIMSTQPQSQPAFEPASNPKLLDEMRGVLRLHHYSIHTERSYLEWVVRYVRFHRMQSRADLQPAEAKIEAFLTDLAADRLVAASTQNQALGALLFMYQKVLGRELEFMEGFERAPRRQRVPVVLSREEVQRLLTAMPEKYRLFGQLLYGTGMRLMEGLRLRVHPVR
jgi:site-specific recombinase XerD